MPATCEFRYGDADDTEVRKVGPLGLVLKAGIWYLVAQKGSAFRTYRVGRIAQAEALDETYAGRPTSIWPPGGHDPRASTKEQLSQHRHGPLVAARARARAAARLLCRASGREDARLRRFPVARQLQKGERIAGGLLEETTAQFVRKAGRMSIQQTFGIGIVKS